MISIRKLKTLARSTALRKCAAILQGVEKDLSYQVIPDTDYLSALGGMIAEDTSLTASLRDEAAKLTDRQALSFSETGDSAEGRMKELLFLCNRIRHMILTHLGAEPSDWDFILPETGSLDPGKRVVMPIQVYLDDVRSPYNVGAVFRTAESFGVRRILISEYTAEPTHKRALRTSMGCTKVIPWERVDISTLDGSEGVFALELGGTPMESFVFPARGTVIIGSEELGVSPEGLKIAKHNAGRVSIPLGGAKSSLNVSVAFGILMHRWYEMLSKPPS